MNSNNWIYDYNSNNSVKWMRKLISDDKGKGLYDVVKYNENNIIICYEDYTLSRWFTCFPSIVYASNFLLNHNVDDMYFHEVINGNFPLKIYFDIDVSKEKMETF